MKPETRSLVANAARWALFFPASIAGAIVAWQLFIFLSRVSIALGGRFDPDSWISRAWLVYASNLIFGVALVYLAAAIAPRGKAIVGTVMAGLMLLLTGSALFPTVNAHKWWDLSGLIAANIGSIAWSIELWRKESSRFSRSDRSL